MIKHLSRSEVLLILVYDYTKHRDNDWANELTSYFYPRESTILSPTLQEKICVYGPGDAAAFRGLQRRGLIKHEGTHPYAFSLTEEGLLKVTKLLEQ